MPSDDTPIVAARRARLKAWIANRFEGSRKAFLEAVEARGHRLDATEVSNLQRGKKSFGEVKADEVETAAGMPKYHLVFPVDLSEVLRLDADMIRAAIRLARESFRLADDQVLEIERDPEVFAQALRAAIAAVQRLEGNTDARLGQGDGQTGAAGSAEGAAEVGPKTESEGSGGRKRVRRKAA